MNLGNFRTVAIATLTCGASGRNHFLVTGARRTLDFSFSPTANTDRK